MYQNVLPGIDKDANAVEDEPFDPSVVTTVVSGHLNPCAASTCTAEETTAGKDNYEDMIVGTTSGHPTLVYVGTSSGTFAPPIKDDASILSIFQSTNLPSSNTIEDTGSVESIVIQDVDADNLPDVVLFHENGPGRVFFADDQTADVFGNALRVPADFTRSLNTPLGLETETHTSLSFFDHDGKTDTGPYLYVGSTLGTKDRLILDLEEANAAGFSVSNEFSIDLEGTDLFSTKQTQVGATTGNPTSSPIPLDLILGTDAGVKGIQAFFAQVPADKTVEWDVTSLLSDLVTLSDMTGASSEDVKALKVGKVDSDDISDVVFSTGDYTAVLFGKDGALFSDAASLSSWKSSHLIPIRQSRSLVSSSRSTSPRPDSIRTCSRTCWRGRGTGRRSSSSRRRTGPSLPKSSSETTGPRARPKHRSRTHLPPPTTEDFSSSPNSMARKTDSLPSSPERRSCSTLAPLPLARAPTGRRSNRTRTGKGASPKPSPPLTPILIRTST